MEFRQHTTACSRCPPAANTDDRFVDWVRSAVARPRKGGAIDLRDWCETYGFERSDGSFGYQVWACERGQDFHSYRQLLRLMRNTRRLGRGGRTLRVADRERIFARDQYICHICREPTDAADPPTVDHIVPLSHGGADDDDNLATAHRSCNGRKNDWRLLAVYAQDDGHCPQCGKRVRFGVCEFRANPQLIDRLHEQPLQDAPSIRDLRRDLQKATTCVVAPHQHVVDRLRRALQLPGRGRFATKVGAEPRRPFDCVVYVDDGYVDDIERTPQQRTLRAPESEVLALLHIAHPECSAESSPRVVVKTRWGERRRGATHQEGVPVGSCPELCLRWDSPTPGTAEAILPERAFSTSSEA